MSLIKKILVGVLLLVLVGIILSPIPSSPVSFSKALFDKEGQLLAAITSVDEQWCFPLDEQIPQPLAIAIKEYEDAYMDWHPGINPISVYKAIKINHEKGKIVRGASTLAMQVMRMRNQNKERIWINKISESISAFKYSILKSDNNIIRDWAEIAPYGGNIIGVKAASLKYFGRPLQNLSWAEYALLAVMPNSPGRTNLKKNTPVILKKRNALLVKLQREGHFEEKDLLVYLDEDLPVEPTEIPQHGYHLLRHLIKKYPDKNIFRTHLISDIQKRLELILQQESDFYRSDDIRNMAAIIIDVEKNQLIAYQGNVKQNNGIFDYVDIIQSPRSYGSLLKPFLYAYALESSQYLPGELVADIPTIIGDFQPKNFDKKYKGAVKIEDMVIQSLNVPAVRILNKVGLHGFYENIQLLQPQFLNKGADHYGLSIILGGGEMSLWDLARFYKGLAQNYIGISNPFQEISITLDEEKSTSKINFKFSALTLRNTIVAMADLTRPREEKHSHLYNPNQKIAWKTGTSYGHRDAWAIGFNGRYTVGVWVGNGDGEGRYDLTGISKAAPVMFKIFKNLPENRGLGSPPPLSRIEKIRVCTESGKMAGNLCNHTHQISVENSATQYSYCSYHHVGYINEQGFRIHKNCIEMNAQRDTFFVLTPMMDYYHKIANPQYVGLPSNDKNCGGNKSGCQIIYPFHNLKIFLPKERETGTNSLICKAHHQESQATLFWFLNGDYVTTTQHNTHEIALNLTKGQYQLTVIDHQGHQDKVSFEILGKR